MRRIHVSGRFLRSSGAAITGWRIEHVDLESDVYELATEDPDATPIEELARFYGRGSARQPGRIDREQEHSYTPEWATPLDTPKAW